MYKDKDKQREANRKAQAKFKAKGITNQGITNQRIANQVILNMRRGKDIKCFEDLSEDVQETIDMISENEHEHKLRTAIAINYQHEFPDRYYSTGVTGNWKDKFRQEHERQGVACMLGSRSSIDGQG